MVLNRKRLGLVIEVLFSGPAFVAEVYSGSWMWAAWSAFAVWALVSSYKQFC